MACVAAASHLRIAFCKICRERIGPRTGGPEGFKCKECEGEGRGPGGGGFWVCLQCYRKSQSNDAQEGILRGDKGPKYAARLPFEGRFWWVLASKVRLEAEKDDEHPSKIMRTHENP